MLQTHQLYTGWAYKAAKYQVKIDFLDTIKYVAKHEEKIQQDYYRT
jgi:hypothetical protein